VVSVHARIFGAMDFLAILNYEKYYKHRSTSLLRQSFCINREILYTLGRNEVVVESEATMLCDIKQRNFAMITYDPVKG